VSVVGVGEPVHVLVVDDSAVVRQVMTTILVAAGMEVTSVSDPIFALERMKKNRPSVILLDVEMPRMDGLTFLKKVMAEDPIPVVVCSGFTGRGTEKALQALREGAVEVLAKPQMNIRENPRAVAELIVEAVRGAARARVGRHGRIAAAVRSRSAVPTPTATAGVRTAPGPARTQRPGTMEPPPAVAVEGGEWIVAIGASTGGTEALRQILTALPANAPPVLVVQHMPAAFTGPFAAALDADCRIQVREAREGDRLARGLALVAPGGDHMRLVARGSGYGVSVVGGPPVSLHRPSVDVLFESVASVGPRGAMVGVLLTGMGADGARGLLAMRQAGAYTIAQDEATSVVFGMPKEAISLGAAADILPLPRIASALCSPGFARTR
jgi:two-component system chemotaxis response regulator CheB